MLSMYLLRQFSPGIITSRLAGTLQQKHDGWRRKITARRQTQITLVLDRKCRLYAYKSMALYEQELCNILMRSTSRSKLRPQMRDEPPHYFGHRSPPAYLSLENQIEKRSLITGFKGFAYVWFGVDCIMGPCLDPQNRTCYSDPVIPLDTMI